MIKGEINQIKVKMNHIEIKQFLNIFEAKKAINIMGVRYLVMGFNISDSSDINLERPTEVLVKVKAIKKGG